MINSATVESWARDLLVAWQSNTPKPTRDLLDLSRDDAYLVQNKLVALRGGDIAGFKAGLTNKSIQNKHGTDEPAGAVLLAEGRFLPDAIIARSDFVNPRIETEVGFVIGTDIERPLELGELKLHLSHWLPMIELVDMGFSSPPVLTDLIAGNVAASRYAQTDYSHDINTANDAKVNLYRDGELLHEGKATDALGDQLVAVGWIVNHMLSQGYSIKAGQVLMTGALGTTHAAEVGKYRADYGEFGIVEFEFI